MLFLSDAQLEAQEKLQSQLKSGTADRGKICQQLLDLDPHDYVALNLLAQLRQEAGDHAAAEELLWRALEAQPCALITYLQLTGLVSSQEALSMGIAELASRKMLSDPVALESAGLDSLDAWKNMPELEGVSAEERLEAMVTFLRAHRDLEPVAVTARLRPHRLIHEVQEAESLERGLVDAIVGEGAAMVPFLIGAMRGWVREVIPDDDAHVAANSMALLGEIGDIHAIPELLELIAMEDPELRGVSAWALDRISQKNPADAARVFAEIAPALEGAQRIAIAERLVRHPNLDTSGALFERLFENFDRTDKDGRDHGFQILLFTALTFRGRPFLDIARRMLRRYGTVLSRSTRRECDEMIEDFALSPPKNLPVPAPSPWDVYQICEGEVNWEAEEEEDREPEDEEEYFPPEPLRRKATPGRNDPCWCGSGKKYKKCHLEADEKEAREAAAPQANGIPGRSGEFDGLRRRIRDLIPPDEAKDAIAEFFGSEKPDRDTGLGLLLDWTMHDRISETYGQPVMAEFLERNRAALNDRERAFVESAANSYVDLFEVRDVKEGAGVELTSLTSGETSFVHDVSMSKALVLWDVVHARIVQAERGTEFSGAVSSVPRRQLDAVRSWMEEDRRRTGLSWPGYLKRNWPRIRARELEISDEWMDSMRLRNNDGDDLVVSKAIYRVVNRAALVAALRSSREIDEPEEEKSFVWLSGPAAEAGNTVLANIGVAATELTLECNSKQRLKRGKKMLAELAGTAVEFRKDEFTSPEELRRELKEKLRPAKPAPQDDIPPEVKRKLVGRYMEKHYAEWPDTKLPALNGKTPRQAVKNAAGKRKVAELLKEFENYEARNRKEGEYAYDFSRLRAELGIKA